MAQHPLRVWLNRHRRVVALLLLAAPAIMIIFYLVVGLPFIIRLLTEQTYPFEVFGANYIFEMTNPYNPQEELTLFLMLHSNRPTLMSYTDITGNAYLVYNNTWRELNNATDDRPINLIFSGSSCQSYGDGRYMLGAYPVCSIQLIQAFPNVPRYEENVKLKYYAAGDFEVYLSTEDGINGTLTRSYDQYLVVNPVETSFTLNYSFTAVLISIVAIVVAGIDVTFRIYDRLRAFLGRH